MGAGKSHVGRQAAQSLGVPFTDTDALITEREGPIELIFAKQGEAHFRALERDVVVGALSELERAPGVVSLGGGAVMDPDIRRALAPLPLVIWLTAPPAVLFARASEGGRPLARDAAAFRRLLRRRVPVYRSLATHTVVNGERRAVDEVAAEVARLAGSERA